MKVNCIALISVCLAQKISQEEQYRAIASAILSSPTPSFDPSMIASVIEKISATPSAMPTAVPTMHKNQTSNHTIVDNSTTIHVNQTTNITTPDNSTDASSVVLPTSTKKLNSSSKPKPSNGISTEDSSSALQNRIYIPLTAAAYFAFTLL
ncbi:hypothetical protein DSO57_1008120 [Entomophthora muscae]|uniref:Uncharacterized protein n=1 Tax=Entomophthora muscae TaxID=34485 RepID=A0ACC2TUZ5_9FUNG|nr:hypothetical protein DSO57_1008120 [Entomophthora muscae]